MTSYSGPTLSGGRETAVAEVSPGASSDGQAARPVPPEAWYTRWLERDLLPDWLIRIGIRHLCAKRLREEEEGGAASQEARRKQLVAEMRSSPIALHTSDANAQHYEVPADFYRWVLGKRLKYSAAYWAGDVRTLDDAEQAMLDLYCCRARIEDGHSVLELGCGWGSLTLYLAERFPRGTVLAVSNSHSQKAFIEEEARRRGLRNLEIVTADMNTFAPLSANTLETGRRFDRVISIEMFEHMRNWPLLLARIAGWMKPGALFFLHIFSHTRFAYPYVVRDASDWMALHFFTGGMMPSHDLPFEFQDDLRLREHWQLSGTHYQKTAEAWLANMDRHRREIFQVFAGTYGEDQALRWWVRWRVFFMACAELWGYRGGREWIVSHYLFDRPALRSG